MPRFGITLNLPSLSNIIKGIFLPIVDTVIDQAEAYPHLQPSPKLGPRINYTVPKRVDQDRAVARAHNLKTASYSTIDDSQDIDIEPSISARHSSANSPLHDYADLSNFSSDKINTGPPISARHSSIDSRIQKHSDLSDSSSDHINTEHSTSAGDSSLKPQLHHDIVDTASYGADSHLQNTKTEHHTSVHRNSFTNTEHLPRRIYKTRALTPESRYQALLQESPKPNPFDFQDYIKPEPFPTAFELNTGAGKRKYLGSLSPEETARTKHRKIAIDEPPPLTPINTLKRKRIQEPTDPQSANSANSPLSATARLRSAKRIRIQEPCGSPVDVNPTPAMLAQYEQDKPTEAQWAMLPEWDGEDEDQDGDHDMDDFSMVPETVLFEHTMTAKRQKKMSAKEKAIADERAAAVAKAAMEKELNSSLRASRTKANSLFAKLRKQQEGELPTSPPKKAAKQTSRAPPAVVMPPVACKPLAATVAQPVFRTSGPSIFAPSISISPAASVFGVPASPTLAVPPTPYPAELTKIINITGASQSTVPDGHSQHTVPVGLSQPIGPVGPSKSTAPVGPSQPTVPVGPSQSTGSIDTSQSTALVHPPQSIAPTDSSQSIALVAPSQSTAVALPQASTSTELTLGTIPDYLSPRIRDEVCKVLYHESRLASTARRVYLECVLRELRSEDLDDRAMQDEADAKLYWYDHIDAYQKNKIHEHYLIFPEAIIYKEDVARGNIAYSHAKEVLEDRDTMARHWVGGRLRTIEEQPTGRVIEEANEEAMRADEAMRALGGDEDSDDEGVEDTTFHEVEQENNKEKKKKEQADRGVIWYEVEDENSEERAVLDRAIDEAVDRYGETDDEGELDDEIASSDSEHEELEEDSNQDEEIGDDSDEDEGETAAGLDSLKLGEKETEATARGRKLFAPFIHPLNDKWDTKVDSTLETTHMGKLVAKSAAGVDISRRDIATILPGKGWTSADPTGWLNDEIVNAWFTNLVSALNQQAGYVKGPDNAAPFATYPTAWYNNVTTKGVDSVKRWSRRHGISGKKVLETEAILLPVNTGVHWIILCISGKNRTITHLDSLDTNTSPTSRKSAAFFEIMREWLEMELGSEYKADEWREVDRRSSIQSNGSDCGVFTCLNGFAFAMNVENPGGEFGPRHMKHARRAMIALLLNGGFEGDFEIKGGGGNEDGEGIRRWRRR